MNERFKIKRSLREFEYFAPEKKEEAVDFLEKYKQEIKVIAGGTDLLVNMRKGEVEPNYLLDLNGISKLSYIKEDEAGIQIGPLTTIDEILNSEIVEKKCPILCKTAKKFGTPQIRNMGTIGGNICNSSPAADMAVPLLALNSELKLIGYNETRTSPIEEFFTGPKKNILENEILAEIKIPQQEGKGDFKKLTRTAKDLAKISVGIILRQKNGKCRDLRITLGSVAKTPIRASTTEERIIGKTLNRDLIEDAANSISDDISPITDVRSDSDYREKTSKAIVRRMLSRLAKTNI